MNDLKPALLAALAATAALTVALAGAAPARAAGGDNVVVAVNTKDGRFLYRVRLVVRPTHGDVVDEANAAVAVASCASCQTVAIAVEGLLVFSDPSIFTPTNLAVAMNVDCSFCATLASAYQLLVQVGERAHLSGAGRQAIAQIRADLEAIRREGLTIAEIQAQVDELAQRLLYVLLTEVETPPGQR
jgi:putative peptide zinc metalloprotease protein